MAANKGKTAHSGSFLVASGILLSRIAGLVRERALAHYFGNSAAGDAFKAALKIPNFLQNLFGEGVLSASFIPVYAGLLAENKKDEANRVAHTVASLLFLITSVFVLAGIAATPVLIDLIAPGFDGDKRDLTIRLVRILFPGTGLLVLSAWCLGILNSHRRFFLSYAAPVLWNAAIIATLIFFGNRTGQFDLALATAWGLVAGSALQFLVQLPTALSLAKRCSPMFATRLPGVRTAVRTFIPAVVARGVVQVSAYVDNVLASLLPTGAVAALSYAQTLYLLPVSLFGMSVSAAALPSLSSARGSTEDVNAYLQGRLHKGLRQITVFVIPSVIAFLALGDVIVAALFQSGVFKREDSLYVWAVLAGASVGLLPSTLGRLYASTFYALHDTRTPLRFAILRLCTSGAIGYVAALHLPALLGLQQSWGLVGLTIASGFSGWFEYMGLRRSLSTRIGQTVLPGRLLAKIWTAAIASAAIAWGIKLLLPPLHPILLAVCILTPYGMLFFALSAVLRVPEAQAILNRLRKALHL